MPRKPDPRPFCECCTCDATGRKTGREVRLPLAAWAVAGGGPDEEGGGLAVARGHEKRFVERGDPVTYHRGWVAVGT